MDITITDAKRCLRWETLQMVVRDVTKDSSVRLTSVTRTSDSGIDYAAPGRYRVTFKGEKAGQVIVNLAVREKYSERVAHE